MDVIKYLFLKHHKIQPSEVDKMDWREVNWWLTVLPQKKQKKKDDSKGINDLIEATKNV